jgi:penicillin-binding protein A
VAGKTGTAELRSTKRCQPDPENPESCPPEQAQNDPSDTDAWFASYAPAGTGRPRIAVGVLLVGAGAGGDTAAPVAREVLRAGLRATS